MERVLHRAAISSPYRLQGGLECGRLKVVAEALQAPHEKERSSSGSCQLGHSFVAPSEISRSSYSSLRSRHSSSMSPAPSTTSSAFPSPLKFFWFNREHEEQSRKYGDVMRTVGFLAHGGSDWESLDGGTQTSPVRNEELDRLVNGPSKSVDITNVISFAEAKTQDSEARSQPPGAKLWIPNFVNLKAFWKKENGAREASARSSTATTTSSSTDSTVPVESCQFTPLSCAGCLESCEAGCTQGQPGGIDVTPHHTIAQNKEYFTKFLHRVPSSERKRIAKMAYLSNLAYRISTIEADELFNYYHLKIMTSSLEITAAAAKEKEKEKKKEKEKEKASVMEQVDKIDNPDERRVGDKKAADEHVDSVGDDTPSASLNPAAGYAMAAAAASCNLQACDILASKAGGDDPGCAADLQDSREAGDVPQKEHERCDDATRIFDQGLEALKSAPNGSHNSGNSARTTVSSVLGATPGDEGAERPATAHQQQSCPCEWFVCDDEDTKTRLVVIQGTETLAAWQANLRFEPTPFEPELKTGVMVHRGIYEAAKGLYEEVLPLIRAHVERHGDDARIHFTGHSLGGSLATLLSLMVGLRKAAPVSTLLPVYTFGSPCIMCGGNYLLECLGLPHSHIQSVVMHLDIVPRTFACDYPDHVATVLKRVSGTFRNHSCLLQQRLIYAPMGEMVILQPEADKAPGHPLLPRGSGLYTLRHPSQAHEHHHPLRLAREVQSAERAFLNVPHPLEMLSDRNAYGSEGSISRDHDCRSYLKALQRIRRQELMERRRSLLEVRRQLWAPIGNAPTNSFPFNDENDNRSFHQDHHVAASIPAPHAHDFAAPPPSLGMVDGHYQDLISFTSPGKQLAQFFHFKDKMMGSSSESDRTVRSP